MGESQPSSCAIQRHGRVWFALLSSSSNSTSSESQFIHNKTPSANHHHHCQMNTKVASSRSPLNFLRLTLSHSFSHSASVEEHITAPAKEISSFSNPSPTDSSQFQPFLNFIHLPVSNRSSVVSTFSLEVSYLHILVQAY